MKKAPTIQYDSASETGGKRSGTSANQPSARRSGLLTDSLSTSRYGHSFRRTGGTLYARPITQSAAADAANRRPTSAARESPAAARTSHSV